MRFLMILALSLLLPNAAPAAAFNRTKSCEPALLAMTYNIRLDTQADGDNSWTKRKHLLIGQIVTMRPHILGLQEVLPNQQDDLKAVLADYDFIGAGRDGGKYAGEASPLIIDRKMFKIQTSGTFWLSPTPDVPSLGWDAAFKRVATWAHLARRSDKAKLLVINSHWDHLGLIARQKSGAQILEWISRHRMAGEQVMLLGDFNADDAEESVAQLSREISGHAMLMNTRAAAAERNFGPAISFNAFNPFPTSGKLIDHIFVSPGISVRAQGVVAQHENGRVPSDHFPVVALLDFPSSRKFTGCRMTRKN